MIFSSTPPPPGVEATEMEMPQPANVTPSKGVVEPMLQRNKALGREFNQIDAQRDALKQRIAAAEERLTQAQQAAIDGETPIAGERQRTTQGANRLLPAYFERQEMLKNRVEQIKTEIDNLRRELQQL